MKKNYWLPLEAVLAIIVLLSSAGCAQAGGHWEITYSTSMVIDSMYNGTHYPALRLTLPQNYTAYNGNYFEALDIGWNKSEGNVTATLSWVTDNNTLPPGEIHLVEHSMAYYSATPYDGLVGADPKTYIDGYVDNGRQQPAKLIYDPSNIQHPYQWFSESWKPITVKVPPDAAFTTTFNCHMQAKTEVNVFAAGEYHSELGGLYELFMTGSDITAFSTHNAPDLLNALGDWDQHNPRYFSGTGCEVVATPSASVGSVTSATLKIGGDVVATYPRTGATTPIMKVLFDSTHFADGTELPIELDVTDGAGAQVPEVIVGQVKNRGYELTNLTGLKWIDQHSANAQHASVLAAYSAMNYSPTDSETAHRDELYAALIPNTVFVANTHAESYDFGDATVGFETGNNNNLLVALITADITDDAGLNIKNHDITHYVNSKPYVMPPFNFVFINGCESGLPDSDKDVNLAKAFGIVGSGRAFCGWEKEIYINRSDNVDFMTKFWQLLVGGDNLQLALNRAVQECPPQGKQTRNGTQDCKTKPVAVGDGSTKLHGVFGGAGLSWFRKL